MTICLFGGLLDGYSFVFRDETFCLVQTGNLVKCIIFFVNGQIIEAVYAMIIILTFCIFIFIFWFLITFLKKKDINYHFITMPLMGLLLIPSIVWKFNSNDFLSYQNLISGIFIAMIGSLMAISFKNVKFKFDKEISFNAAMMTGNMRSMMETIASFVKTKDKEKGYQSFCYLTMILIFILGVAISAICGKFIEADWDRYSLFIILYALIIAMIIIFHYRYKWLKDIETKQSIIS